MVNKVTLIGRLGKDPEIRHFENDGAVCNFSLATTYSYRTKSGEKSESTEWHNLVIWNKGALIAEKYLKKGSLLYVEGRLATRSWDADGVKKYTTEIIVENFKMLGAKGESEYGGNDAPSESTKESTGSSADLANDTPF